MQLNVDNIISSIKIHANKFNCNAQELLGFTWNVQWLNSIYTWRIIGINDALHMVDYKADIRSEFWELYVEHDVLHDDIDVIKEVEANVLPFEGTDDPEEE